MLHHLMWKLCWVFWHLLYACWAGGKTQTDWYSEELQLKPVNSLIPHFTSILLAQEAKSSRQPFPWHCLQVLWTSSIRLHRIPRQVSNTHAYKLTRPNWVVVHRPRIRSRLCFKAGTCILFPLPTHQSDPPSPILLHCLFCLSISCSCTCLCLHCGRNVSH